MSSLLRLALAFFFSPALVLVGDLVGAYADVMEEARQCCQCHGGDPERLGDSLPQRHHRTDGWIFGKIAVKTRLISMVQHIHDVCAAYTCRVIQAGVVESARLQIDNAVVGVLDHVFFGAEHNGTRRTGLDARRLLAHRNAIRTQGTFVCLVVFLGDTRNVERASGNAIPAADAVFLVKIDNAVVVLNDGTRSRASLEAAGVFAVHAAVLADQPFKIARVVLVLGKTHERPGVLGKVHGVVIHTHVRTDFVPDVVPFHAGYLACLAAYAFGGVDKLGYTTAHDHIALAGHGGGGSGAPLDIQ